MHIILKQVQKKCFDEPGDKFKNHYIIIDLLIVDLQWEKE